MKKILFIITVVFFISGCGMYYIPFEAKLDNSTKRKLQPVSPRPADIAVYLDKEIAQKVISQKAEGATCGHAVTQIPFGIGLSNSISEALSIAFPNIKKIDSPERPKNFILLKIYAPKIDIGFEFSASADCVNPIMDQGRISLSLKTQVINLENQMVLDETFDYAEKEIDRGTPPPSQTVVLERCLNKIITNYVEDLKNSLNTLSRTRALTGAGQPFTVSQEGASEYTLTINQTGTGSGHVSNDPTGTRFFQGAVVTLTPTPDSNSNFVRWSEACTEGSPSCFLTMNSNLAATATFNLKTFTINATVTGNGTISPQGMVSVNYRATQRFFITPAAGYKVNDVRIDGVSIGAISSYVFGNIKADHAITAGFLPKQ
jgi:hypothetical protein